MKYLRILLLPLHSSVMLRLLIQILYLDIWNEFLKVVDLNDIFTFSDKLVHKWGLIEGKDSESKGRLAHCFRTWYWSPSTSASTCVGVLLRIRAELPRIRRIPILWNRCLICSSVSLPVWLAKKLKYEERINCHLTPVIFRPGDRQNVPKSEWLIYINLYYAANQEP